MWLKGPVQGVPELLQPVAHALVEAAQDVRVLLQTLSTAELWMRPYGAASVGFHVRHSQGSLDRLFTYARGEHLSEAQRAALSAEKSLDAGAGGPAQLAAAYDAMVDRALDQLRSTSPEDLLQAREVGRAKLPSNVIGLLCHAAEHTYRHVGQAVTTARIVKGMIGGAVSSDG